MLRLLIYLDYYHMNFVQTEMKKSHTVEGIELICLPAWWLQKHHRSVHIALNGSFFIFISKLAGRSEAWNGQHWLLWGVLSILLVWLNVGSMLFAWKGLIIISFQKCLFSWLRKQLGYIQNILCPRNFKVKTQWNSGAITE